jgi:hypothetical protein
MADQQADGAIAIAVNLDTTDAQKRLDSLRKKIDNWQSQLYEKKIRQSAIEMELDKAGQVADLVNAKVKALQDQIESYKGRKLTADEVTEVGKLTAELEKELENQKEQNKNVNVLKEKYRSVTEEMKIHQNQIDIAKEKAAELAETVAKEQEELRQSATYNVADSGIVELQKQYDELLTRKAQLESHGIGLGYAEYDGVVKKLEEINQELKDYRKNLTVTGQQAPTLLEKVKAKLEEIASSTHTATSGVEKFADRVGRLAKRVLVFSVITSGLRALKTWMGKVIAVNDEATASLASLKGALLTMAQPIINVVIPALVTVINLLTRFATIVANIISKLFKTSIKKSSEQAKSLYEQTEALNSVGSAAESAEGSLASFDEINTIQTESTSGGGTSSTTTVPDFDLSSYRANIDELTVYLSGALLVLGAFLTFSGANIPLGLGLMALGAVGLAAEITENWNAMDTAVGNAIIQVLTTLGLAALVIGAILAFSGANIPLGIGLMVLGAVMLGTAAALKWTTLDEQVKNNIASLMGILGVALLVIGAVIALSGANLPLGIGLMVAGAVMFGASIALRWTELKERVENNRDDIANSLALFGVVALAIGAIIALSGANIPLGIGIMAVGAASLVSAVVLNWETIKNFVSNNLNAILSIAGGALLALGLFLICTGVNIPLGIALLAAGAVSLVAVTAINWNAILQKLQGVWASIKNWWNTKVAKYFTKAFWQEKFSTIGEALKAKIKVALNAGIALVRKFTDWINDKFNLKWDSFDVLGKTIIQAGTYRLLTLPTMPFLAQGAVIPPNREFMAVLGDQKSGNNLETPESLLRQIVREESGGGNDNTEILMAILEAIKAGQVMKVNGDVLAKTAVNGINKMTVAAGAPVLIL